MLKLVGIVAGLKTLLYGQKKSRKAKKNHRR